MAFHSFWLHARPDLQEELRKANEARAATYYAAYKTTVRTLGATIRAVGAAVRRLRDVHRARRELNALDDRVLRDIGFLRPGAANTYVAANGELPEARRRIAESRRAPRELVRANGGRRVGQSDNRRQAAA